MSDELDKYEDGVERDEAEAAKIDEELALSDADQISDGSAEQDETSFDETRHEYSGAEEGTATSTWRRWRRPAPCSTTPREPRCASVPSTIRTAVTAKSEADGTRLRSIYRTSTTGILCAPRRRSRPVGRDQRRAVSYRSSSCPTFRAPGRRPTAEPLYRSDATFFERLHDEAMIDLAPEEVAGAIRARP